MTSEQFAQLLKAISDRPYTLTGAADWPLLVVLGVGLVGLIGLMWNDLKDTIRNHRGEWQIALNQYKEEHKQEHDHIWTSMEKCKDDCCPPRQRG